MTHFKLKKASLPLSVIGIALVALFFLWPQPVIIDTHAHIESTQQLDSLLKANRKLGIEKTYLMASPKEVLDFSTQANFTSYKDNFETLLSLKAENPDAFEVFCTLSPLSVDMLNEIKDCYENGGVGIKLYNGHSNYFRFFDTALDDPKMMEVYAFAESNNLPLSFDININAHGPALRVILDAYPALHVSVPHLMISSVQLDNVESLLKIYPNLYTDISFSAPEFTAAGFRRLSVDSEKFSNFLETYSDQILFGSDMVLSSAGNEESLAENRQFDYRKDLLNCYKKLLSRRSFTCPLVKNYYGALRKEAKIELKNCELAGIGLCNEKESEVERQTEWFGQVKRLNGLNLSKETLDKIYSENAERFLSTSR